MAVFAFRDTQVLLDERVDDLVSRLSLDEKIGLMGRYQQAIPRLGIAANKQGTEAAHGIAWLGKATVFPQPIGLACTWDTDLLRRVGETIGTEARAYHRRKPETNGLTLWTPTDLQRDPRRGRCGDAFGEDPLLAGTLAAALVQGVQGNNRRFLRAVATLRHFVAHDNERDPHTASSDISRRVLREYYMRPFEIAITEGGALSLMTSYKAINGVPGNLNSDIRRVVKREWGMKGFVASDSHGLTGTWRDHRTVETPAEAFALSIRAGIDSLTESPEDCRAAICAALERKLISETDLDQALRNSLTIRFRLGEFDPEISNPYARIKTTDICKPESSALAREAVRKSVVLLKNDAALLPLWLPVYDDWAPKRGLFGETPSAPATSDPSEATLPHSPHIHTASAAPFDSPPKYSSESFTRKLAVIGPLADQVLRDRYSGVLPYAISPVTGIRAYAARASGNPSGSGWIGGDPQPGSDQDGLYVRFASGRDTVRIRSLDTGLYVRLQGNTGTLRADAAKTRDAKSFVVDDWGWGAITLKSVERVRFVRCDTKTLAADSKEPAGVNVQEVLRIAERAETRQNTAVSGSAPHSSLIAVNSAAAPAISERRLNLYNWKNEPIVAEAKTGLLKTDGVAAKFSIDAATQAKAGEAVNLPPEAANVFAFELLHDGIAEAVEAAASCDTAIVCIGDHPMVHAQEGSQRRDLEVPARHEALVKAVHAVNPRTVVVIVGSYPFALPWIQANIPAVVYTSHGGQELGNGLAEIIFGAHSPAGRLDMTWYASAAQLGSVPDSDIAAAKHTYLHFDGKPLYPFGHGLTYTSFEYGDLEVKGSPPPANFFAAPAGPETDADSDGVALVIEIDDTELTADEPLSISFSIRNTGDRDSDEVAQIYLAFSGGTVPRPRLQLTAFKRLHLKTGETQKLTFVLDTRDFAFWDEKTESFRVEAGTCDILVGTSSADIRLVHRLRIS